VNDEGEHEETYSRANHIAVGPRSLLTAKSVVEPGGIIPEPRQSQPLSCLLGGNETILIGLIDNHSFTRQCITGFLKEVSSAFDFIPFESCEDFLQHGGRFDLILYHQSEQVKFSDTSDTAPSRIKTLAKIAPVIILSPNDSNDLLFEAFECGARGFILTANTSCKEVVEIIRFVKAGGTFVPLSSLALQRADRSASLKTHQFTLRELAVLDRLILGKTNKAIAHELQTSESTVKVHIRNMMKKMSAKNRTEVVCLAYELIARAGALSEPAITEENRRDKAFLPVREQSLSVGDGEKTALMAEVEAEDGQVSVVAQRHGTSKNLLYN